MKLMFLNRYLFCVFIVALIPLVTNAEPINFLSEKVEILDSPNGKHIATLLNTHNLSIEYKSKKIISDTLWLKVSIDAWIWRKSTDIKTGEEKTFQLVVTKENFRIFPGKEKIAVINKEALLKIIKYENNWIKAKLSGWLPANKTNFKHKVPNVIMEDKQAEQPTIPQELKSVSEERDTAIKELQELRLSIVKTNKEQKTEPQKKILDENTGIFTQNALHYILISIIAFILLTFVVVLLIAIRIKNQKYQFKEIDQLIQKNITLSDHTNENVIKKFEENKGVVKYELEKRISEFQENLLKNLNETQQTTVNSLSTFNMSQNESFSVFNEKTVSTLSEMNNKITSSLSDSTKNQSESLSIFNEKIISSLSEMKNNISNSLNNSTKIQSDSLSEFRDKTSETIENSLKRTTDSLANMFDELRKTTDTHMEKINTKVEDRLKDGFQQTNKVFSDIKDRLLLIDQAQQKISDLSRNVISLQETLDNKGARGAFGEIQLSEIVRDMIPEKYCKFQEKLSNDKRPDCLIILPPPTGNLAIDAKFPLENYKIMFDKEVSTQDKGSAKSNFKRDIKKHIKDISEKYIIPGETANGAVMFIPSEAVFSEIHAHHPDLVKEAQIKKVWMASPSTLMALLTTARAVLSDDERSKQAKIIHDHLHALSIEFSRFSKRMDALSRHIGQANEDVNSINITARKISDKFGKIERTELETLDNNVIALN